MESAYYRSENMGAGKIHLCNSAPGIEGDSGKLRGVLAIAGPIGTGIAVSAVSGEDLCDDPDRHKCGDLAYCAREIRDGRTICFRNISISPSRERRRSVHLGALCLVVGVKFLEPSGQGLQTVGDKSVEGSLRVFSCLSGFSAFLSGFNHC